MSYSVDNFSVDHVVRALRSVSLSDKAVAMLRAHATAPNRALSRLELARVVGGSKVETCNAVYGRMAGIVSRAIDPEIKNNKEEPGSGDFVMFLNYGPRRHTKRPADEPDPWVFVMRDTLAHALDRVGIARYTALEPYWARELAVRYDGGVRLGRADEDDDDDHCVFDPLDPPFRSAEEDIENARDQLSALGSSVREAVILARYGQGRFRAGLLADWGGGCSVSGVSIPAVLIASHIKPWRVASNTERLDHNNGLLLMGTLDRLFDAGLITFENNGAIRISDLLPADQLPALGLSARTRLRRVTKAHHPYLAYHRKHVFVSSTTVTG